MMSSVTGISVVVPNYNGQELVPQILPTVIAALRQTGLPGEIILVDDCSTDRSVELLSKQFPQVTILQNETNSGFSVTSNKGIRAARYKWVLLLNSDVKLEQDYFLPLLKYADRADTLGVMGRIVGWYDEKIQDGAKYPFFHGVKIKTSGNYLLKNEEDMTQGIYSMYLSGANAFLNKEIFQKIGGFNELFSPFYVEDFELSLRAWRLGYTCYYDHFAVCRHKTSTTIVGANKKRRIREIYNRNKMFLHAIHLGKGRRILWYLQLLSEALVHLITLKWSFLKALGRFLGSYNGVRTSRKKMQELAGDKKLLSANEVVENVTRPLEGREIIRF